MTKQTLAQVRKLQPVCALNDELAAQLLEQAQEVTLSKGDALFMEGDSDAEAWYLIEGEISRQEMASKEKRQIAAGDPESRFPIGNLQPRPFSAIVASKQALAVKVPRDTLEKLLAWSQMNVQADTEVSELERDDVLDPEWMCHVLRTERFLSLPTENIERFFAAIEQFPVEKDQVVIRQGEPGDYYYLVHTGQCQVSRESNGQSEVLAELGPGDAFGEEALITNKPRNATITMLSDGLLMRLSADAFQSLLKAPSLERVGKDRARELVKQGGKLVDVRTAEEHAHRAVKGSLNLPLKTIRETCQQLPQDVKHVLYCDSGSRSAAAAYLLQDRGFDVCVLDGGLGGLVKH